MVTIQTPNNYRNDESLGPGQWSVFWTQFLLEKTNCTLQIIPTYIGLALTMTTGQSAISNVQTAQGFISSKNNFKVDSNRMSFRCIVEMCSRFPHQVFKSIKVNTYLLL